MKNFLLLVVICLSTFVHAQKLQLGVNGGYCYIYSSVPDLSIHNEITGYRGGIQALLQYGKYSYGISADLRRFATLRYTPQPPPPPGFTWIDRDPTTSIRTVSLQTPVKFFANRIFPVSFGEIYAGFATGCSFARIKSIHYWGETLGDYNISHSRNVLAGMQMGTSIALAEKIEITAEIAAEYYPYFSYGYIRRIYAFSFPASVGIRYNL